MLIKAKNYSAGSGIPIKSEETVDVKFKIHKFTVRRKPRKEDIVIFPIFSEFGCEVLSAVYCLPELLMKKGSKYSIVAGWSGRSYFYKHLVDEFWEIEPEFMWLREYCRAFHHVSKNLKSFERNALSFGKVIDINELANVAVFPKIDQCSCGGNVKTVIFNQECSKCKKSYSAPGLFFDVDKNKKKAVWLPKPSEEKLKWAEKNLPENAVGITARKRITWGRNFPSLFYERLIYLIEDMGYTPVWMGEKATSLECPFKRILDYSSMPQANDLEQTLALVSKMKFTVQYYTASTRLSGLTGTPFLVFESPDQIWGNGQEGMRLALLSKGPKKIVTCQYKLAIENQSKVLDLTEKSINEMLENNYSDMIGLVHDKKFTKYWRQSQLAKFN